MFPASLQIAQDARTRKRISIVGRAKKPDSQISRPAYFAEYWMPRQNEEVKMAARPSLKQEGNEDVITDHRHYQSQNFRESSLCIVG
jgi:hypothetical protein